MNEQYLHPVLTSFDEAVVPKLSKESSKLTVTNTTDDDFLISIELLLDDDYIKDLISKGKAQYAVEIYCSDTMYRRLYPKKENVISIAIARRNVINKVTIRPYVFLAEPFDYCNPSANEYFDGETFPLQKGDVLVEFPAHSFDAVLTYTLSSIFNIRPNTDDLDYKYVKFSLTQEKIRILLPVTDYDLYRVVRSDDKSAPLFLASIVQSALLYALYNGGFKDEPKETDELWKKSIRDIVETKFPEYDLKNENCYVELSQVMQENPFSQLFGKLPELFEIK